MLKMQPSVPHPFPLAEEETGTDFEGEGGSGRGTGEGGREEGRREWGSVKDREEGQEAGQGKRTEWVITSTTYSYNSVQ